MSKRQAREHENSYYAATQRDAAPFPALNGDVSAEVCIVGGGLTGVAAAVEFAERGRKVVLLEANRIGWGASGRNGGQIIGGVGGALSFNDRLNRKLPPDARRALVDMGVECVDIIRDRIAKYGIECDLRWGFLDVALKQSELADFEATLARRKAQSYPHESRLLDRNELREYLGADRYVGGLVNEGWGHLHVLDLCKGEARAAESLGAEIYEQTVATSIDYGDVVRIHTPNGAVTAETAVLCGNAYLARLAPKLAPKLSRYILPATSYMIATEPLSEALANDVMPRNYAVCDQRTALDYFRLSADNRMLFGGLSKYSAMDPHSVARVLRAKMLKVFPQLEPARIDYHWGGHMGISFRRVPQLGQLHPNVYYAQAYSGHGVAPTHMSGRLIAEAVSGNKYRYDIISQNWQMPFPGFGALRQLIYAAGMSYFKLLDELK